MRDPPTLADLALTSVADDAVARSAAMIRRAQWDIEATRSLIEQGRQSIERSQERLRQLALTDRLPRPIRLSETASP